MVEQISRWLEDEAKLPVWLDQWDIIPGDHSQEEMEKALDECLCCVVFVGPNGIGSWQNEEIRSATHSRISEKSIRVIPALLPGVKRPGKESILPRFLRGLTWVDFKDRWDDPGALHRLVCGIKGEKPGRDTTGIQEGVCPFRGLEIFREQDREFFFGRDVLVQRLLDKLADSRFLAVTGPSGSGKSSIVQAGLISCLRLHTEVALFTPGERPVEELAFALRACYPKEAKPPAEQLRKRLHQAGDMLHVIAREMLEFSAKKNLLVVIDQFEELFAQTQNEEHRQCFISLLLEAVEVVNGPVTVILTLRSDFIGKCAYYKDLNMFINDNFVQVEPMGMEELRMAIEEPARMVGLGFEEGLVNRVLEDVKGAPGELPLLEHALLELYERRDGGRLFLQAYDAIGGISGALVNRAESEYKKLDDTEKEILRKMFVLRLIQPGEGTEDTRRRATKEELLSINQTFFRGSGGGLSKKNPGRRRQENVLSKWIDSRLLTSARDTSGTLELVDVAHEALIRKWDRLREWMAVGREAARLTGILRQAALEWKQANHSPDYLFQGARLVQMEELVKAHVDDLTDDEIEFIEAGVKLRVEKKLEKEEQRRKELRRKRVIIQIFIVLFVALLLLSIYSFYQRNIAIEQSKKMQRNMLIAEALQELPKNNIKALRIAEAAYEIFPEPTPRLSRVISEAAISTLRFPLYSKTYEHEGRVASAVFSPDGTRILTASFDKTAKAWDLDGNLLADLTGHTHFVNRAVFSPSGRLILTASADGTAKLWDLRGKIILSLNHNSWVSTAVFSPDETLLLTASYDGIAKLWAINGKPLSTLTHSDCIYTAVFSSDGSRILTASKDKTAKVWNLKGKLLTSLNKHKSWVISAVFSPDDKRILTASCDKTARLWTLDGEPITHFKHNGFVYSAVFSPEGKKVLTSSYDKKAKLWNLEGKLLAECSGHTNYIFSAVFSPDGRRILTASYDLSAKLWDLKGNLLADLNKHKNSVCSAVFSPDGTRILTAEFHNRAILWCLNENFVINLDLHTASVDCVDFSPCGELLLTASSDNTAKLWNISGEHLAEFKHNLWVRTAFFSPNGTRVLTASWDNTAKLWDLKSNLVTIIMHADAVDSAVFSPDGKKILTASRDNTAKLWSFDGNLLADLDQHKAWITSAVFSPDGKRILTASNDKTVKVWDLKGKLLIDLDKHTAPVSKAIFSPDGNRILSASYDSTTKLWDLEGNLLIDKSHGDWVNSVDFSPDSTMIITATGNFEPRIWDLNGNLLSELSKHNYWVTDAIFSPDGMLILSTSYDRSAKLWDLKGNLLANLNKHSDIVWKAAFSPDGSRLLTASKDGTAKLWYTPKTIYKLIKSSKIPNLEKKEMELLGLPLNRQ